MDARRLDEAQDSLYNMEHWLAWLMALGAIVLGVIGGLTGFGIIELRDAVTAVDIPGVETGTGAATVFEDNFWDGAMLIFAGLTAAILAYTLHANDHHRLRNLSTVEDSERGLWSAEHSLAYLFALGAVTLVVIGLLTGFGAFSSDNDQRDGLIWIWLGLGSAILTQTLHAVRHHQVGVEQDYIVAIIEERAGRTAPRAVPGTEPRTERMR
jgi:hypothetical protein